MSILVAPGPLSWLAYRAEASCVQITGLHFCLEPTFLRRP
jgi:hypothetical protein